MLKSKILGLFILHILFFPVLGILFLTITGLGGSKENVTQGDTIFTISYLVIICFFISYFIAKKIKNNSQKHKEEMKKDYGKKSFEEFFKKYIS